MNLAKAYNYYALANGIEWIKPNHRYERRLCKIPASEQINKLVASASPRYATILKVLAETGIMPHELSRVSTRDIDLERGLLKTYLLKNKRQYPFPKSIGNIETGFQKSSMSPA